MNTITTKDGTQSTTRLARVSPSYSVTVAVEFGQLGVSNAFLASNGYRCIAHDRRATAGPVSPGTATK